MEAEREAMVEKQLRGGGITDERVLKAMGEVPRERFVPKRHRRHAYADGALPIGHGQTISQPWVVAAICQALELEGGERVLDVGGGAGYSTAVIAALAGPNGFVRSYELVPELAARAEKTLAELGLRAEVMAGDGAAHADDEWDAIAVHAAAPDLPLPLAQALRPGGRIVLPLARHGSDVLTSFTRSDNGSGDLVLERSVIAHCRFVPLLGESGFASRDR